MRTCEVDGCERTRYARGICWTHYRGAADCGHLDRWPTRHLTRDAYIRPTPIPEGWVPPDAGQPQPYSQFVIAFRAVMERRDAERDRRDANVYPQYETAYVAQVERYRAQGREAAA